MAGVPLGGQSPTAGFVGIVRDATGAGVPGAAIKVRNTQTNNLRDVVSDHAGGFAVPGLVPGLYEVSVEKPGFQGLRETGLELQVNQTVRLELQLRVGTLSESVEVKAQVPLLNTENASRGDVIMSQELLEMPLDGRNFQDLALLIPGVVPNAEGDFSGPFAINGARSDNTNFYLDGFNNRAPRFGGAMANPNLDAMQEFKLETSNFSAEYGRLAGGVLSVVFKSGTNNLHGTLFEFLRNDKLDARNFFADDKNKLRRNQFGAILNGPVWIPKIYNGRDRTFFMFSWESYRQVSGVLMLSRVPTALERQGDFSQTRDVSGALVQARDPFAANTVFPGNRIPANRFHAISVKMIPYWPVPNRPDQANNFYASTVSSGPWDSFLWKFDQKISSKDNVSFRYHRRTSNGTVPFPGSGSPLGTFSEVANNTEHLVGLNATHLFTPTLINEFRFGLTRTVTHQISVDAGHDFGAQFGINGITTDPHLTGFPKVSVRDLAVIGDEADRPVDNVVNLYQWSDAVTWVKNRHQVKFGGDILRSQSLQPYYANNRGTFNFLGNWTGQPFADFLLGLPDSASRQSTPPQNYLYSTDTGVFVQDDFKVSSRLTLNLGLRWEVPGPQLDKYDRISGFVREVGKLILADDRGITNLPALVASVGLTGLVGVARDYSLPRSLIYTRYRNLAPRFGFAWRPFGGSRTVVRGGYGIFYSKSVINPVTQVMSNVFPWALNQSVNRVASNPSAISFADPFRTAAGTLGNVGGLELHAPTPYLESWNLTVERELKWLGAAEMAYAGSKGTHLGYSSDINRNYYTLDMRLPNGTFPKPYPQINNNISYLSFGANSIYNAGTFTLRRRFSSGFFYRLNYVYAKSIDEGSALQFGAAGNQRQIQDPRNLAAERGRSNFDRGHAFTMDFSYRIPWRGSAALGRLLGGWQLAGSGRASTGPPFTPFNSNVNLALGGAVRPDRLRNGTVPNPTPERWFDVSAFPVVPNTSYRFGNSGRNILDGPGFAGINFSLSKNMTVREHGRLQFRWEVFNALNHANFSLPNSSVAAITGGTIVSAGAARTMQFGMRFEF
jgi:hypothetical protein